VKLSIFILILLCLGCYKKDSEIEAIPIDDIRFNTILKNHTPGIDYIIHKNLEVTKELIIEEGVEIIVEDGCELKISETGVLHINGSSSQPVKIKNKSKTGRWKGISIASKDESSIKFTEISGSGQLGENHAAIEVLASGKLSISNTKILDNGDASGILLTENATCTLNSTEIRGNKYPIQKELFATFQHNNCKFEGNQFDVICIRNQDGSNLLAKRSLKISQLGLPYFFTSTLLLSEYLVTIDAGVNLLFNSGCGIRTVNTGYNYQLLQVNGNSTQSVTLGSLKSGQNDLWSGVMLYNGTAKIHYAVFEKAFLGNKNIGTLSLFGSATIDCRNCTFYADKDQCNISVFGSSVTYNPDISIRNTFKNSKNPCIQ
jgi:hypothetical protein